MFVIFFRTVFIVILMNIDVTKAVVLFSTSISFNKIKTPGFYVTHDDFQKEKDVPP